MPDWPGRVALLATGGSISARRNKWLRRAPHRLPHGVGGLGVAQQRNEGAAHLAARAGGDLGYDVLLLIGELIGFKLGQAAHVQGSSEI